MPWTIFIHVSISFSAWSTRHAKFVLVTHFFLATFWQNRVFLPLNGVFRFDHAPEADFATNELFIRYVAFDSNLVSDWSSFVTLCQKISTFLIHLLAKFNLILHTGYYFNTTLILNLISSNISLHYVSHQFLFQYRKVFPLWLMS